MSDHIPTYTTREFYWTNGFDQQQHEPRVHWTCSCGRDNAKAGHRGGYTTQHKAENGHHLHVLRAPKETS